MQWGGSREMLLVPGWVENVIFINKDKYALVGSSPQPNSCLGHLYQQKVKFYCNTWVIIAILSLKVSVYPCIHFDYFPTRRKLFQHNQDWIASQLFPALPAKWNNCSFSVLQTNSLIFALLIKGEVMHSITFICLWLMLNIYNTNYVQKCAC